MLFRSNQINQFSVKNANGTFAYNFPLGGMLDVVQSSLNSNNVRGQINYNKTIEKVNAISAIAGAEIKESITKGSLYRLIGYDEGTGIAATSLNYNTFYTLFPSFGSARLPAPTGNITGITYRFISYYANAAYTYNGKYTMSVSGRRDGANLFGVKTNDKIRPFWSAGIKWNIDKEKFYSISWLPYLKLRMTYGYNGNVYNGGAYLTGQFTTGSISGAPYVNISTPPNPELRWEKVKNINIGLDFALKKDIIDGTVDFFQKEGLDLIETAPLAPSTGFSSFNGNAASTRAKGIDLILNSRNIDKKFKWYTNLLLSSVNNKVTHYDQKYQGLNLVSSVSGIALEGKPLNSLYGYRWAGIDPANGDPLGYLNKQTSKDYTSIINNASPDSLIFHGSAKPTIFGSIRNTFSYKNFSFSFNIAYKLKYYFRASSVSLNYQDVLITPHSDYVLRWQKPGDEINSSVPSLIYPNNVNRNNFYKYSEILVEKGDHIRFRDIQLSFDLNRRAVKKLSFNSVQFYIYCSNLGLIWKANNKGLDPDYNDNLFVPTGSYSGGVKVSF